MKNAYVTYVFYVTNNDSYDCIGYDFKTLDELKQFNDFIDSDEFDESIEYCKNYKFIYRTDKMYMLDDEFNLIK